MAKPGLARSLKSKVPLFAALGDETRLTIIVQLSTGQLLSITQLTESTAISRQAVTKHLRVLQTAGLVRSEKKGREQLFRMEPESIEKAKSALNQISLQWDQALGRLAKFVEKDNR